MFLNDYCLLASWPTPNALEFGCRDVGRMAASRHACKERTGNGNGFGLALGQAVALELAGWMTPAANDTGTGKGYTLDRGDVAKPRLSLLGQARSVAAWQTPQATDDRNTSGSRGRAKNPTLRTQAKDLAPSGPTPDSSSAATGSTAARRLNPLFSLWLMGFPTAWGRCAARATRSSRTSRPSSSARSSTTKEN